ncbi:MAG TPA: hypothetical protein VNA25_19360 [Phycisphaerae bacterium]|nr:hypothetical protein [Phycisphaerae bacterium]
MLDAWTTMSLAVFDTLLGRVLTLPSDAVLLVVAIGSAAILTVVRVFTTDQDLLGRAAADKRRLGVLIREARRRGDAKALKRLRATKPQVAMRTLGSEGLPLLVSLLPIAMLATWCLARLEFHPPQDGEAIRVIAYTPVSAAGGVMHLVPQDGLEADAWVQPVAAVAGNSLPHGLAAWTLRARAADVPYRLTLRLKHTSVERPMRVGGRTYTPALVDHGDGLVTEIRMRPLRLLGIVPGIAAIGFPPWLVAYLVIVIPFVFILKRLLRIY